MPHLCCSWVKFPSRLFPTVSLSAPSPGSRIPLSAQQSPVIKQTALILVQPAPNLPGELSPAPPSAPAGCALQKSDFHLILYHGPHLQETCCSDKHFPSKLRRWGWSSSQLPPVCAVPPGVRGWGGCVGGSLRKVGNLLLLSKTAPWGWQSREPLGKQHPAAAGGGFSAGRLEASFHHIPPQSGSSCLLYLLLCPSISQI